MQAPLGMHARGPEEPDCPLLCAQGQAGTACQLSTAPLAAPAPLPCIRSGAHNKGVTAMLPLASEAPGGPDMLLTAGADGTIAGARPVRTVLASCLAALPALC